MSDVFHVQSIVVVHHHMIFGTVKAQRIVSPRTNLDNPVDGEVLRVVLEVVPTARHDVAHVCAGDVNKVLVAALRWLGIAPVAVEKRCAIVPAVLSLGAVI